MQDRSEKLRSFFARYVAARGGARDYRIEQAFAAGRAVGEVSFNALIANSLINNSLIIDTLMIGAQMLVTLGRPRSRTGSSNPVVFNLSTAQMLSLFSHWTHISLI